MYPHERSLVKTMEGRPFVLLGVNSDGDREALKKVMADQQITWRSWWDGGGTSGPIASLWGVEGWPTLFLLDHRGVIRRTYLGFPGEDEFDGAVESLVKDAERDQGARPAG
jgi:hypothetical protein